MTAVVRDMISAHVFVPEVHRFQVHNMDCFDVFEIHTREAHNSGYFVLELVLETSSRRDVEKWSQSKRRQLKLIEMTVA